MSRTSPATLHIARASSVSGSIRPLWQSGLQLALSLFAAGMMGLGVLRVITLLVWVPAVVAEPKVRMPWTALWIS